VEYLPVNQEQHKALETLTRYYEQTGNSKEHVSAAVQTVLAKAKDTITLEE
jgi:flavin-binding protein dodecin